MTVDATRVGLVMNEYRYAIVEDTSISAKFPKSVPVEILTNLDATSAATLATTIFNQVSPYARSFQVVVEDVLYLEDFTTSPNRYAVTFKNHPAAGTGQTYTLIGASVDYLNNRTTLTVRG